MKTYMDMTNGIPESGITVICEGQLTRIFFGYSKVKTKSEEGTRQDIVCECVDVHKSRSYEHIVAAIVNNHYDEDDTIAILANKALADDANSDITDEKRKEYQEQYDAFQSWRTEAKNIAKQVLDSLK